MRKAVKNCRNLNMQTIRLRRSRPSSLSVALALAITMFVVWLISLQSCPRQVAAAAAMRSTAEILMESMDARFLLSSMHDDKTQANVAAALCAQNDGAGIVLTEGDQFAVVQETGHDFSGSEAPVIRRSARGLTLKTEGSADTISTLSDGLSALRALAEETGSLAASLQNNTADANTVCALLSVYKTQLEDASAALAPEDDPAAALIRASMEQSILRLASAMESPTPGEIRLIHAKGCLEWIDLSNRLCNLA